MNLGSRELKAGNKVPCYQEIPRQNGVQDKRDGCWVLALWLLAFGTLDIQERSSCFWRAYTCEKTSCVGTGLSRS